MQTLNAEKFIACAKVIGRLQRGRPRATTSKSPVQWGQMNRSVTSEPVLTWCSRNKVIMNVTKLEGYWIDAMEML